MKLSNQIDKQGEGREYSKLRIEFYVNWTEF
jgi:hypothetical protein